MEGNECAKGEYRSKLFELVPTLEIVDGVDKSGEDVESTVNDEGDEFDECTEIKSD